MRYSVTRLVEIAGLDLLSARPGDPLHSLADVVDSLVGVPQQLLELHQQLADLWKVLTLGRPTVLRSTHSRDGIALHKLPDDSPNAG